MTKPTPTSSSLTPAATIRSKAAFHLATKGGGLIAYQSVGSGTLIAFATAPGNTAADGTGAHSPFTTALLKHIGESGVEVNQMLTRVRIEVATEKKQIPWVN